MNSPKYGTRYVNVLVNTDLFCFKKGVDTCTQLTMLKKTCAETSGLTRPRARQTVNKSRRRTSVRRTNWHEKNGTRCGKDVEQKLINEQILVTNLVTWCIERGFSGSGLSVRPTVNRKGRGLEATRVIEKGECVLSVPLRRGIVDEERGHPEEVLALIKNAPWGVRLACRLLQELKKRELSEFRAYLELLPVDIETSPLHYSEDLIAQICYPQAQNEIREMKTAVNKWFDLLEKDDFNVAIAGATREEFTKAVAVVHSRTYGMSSGETGEGYFRALLPLADLLNHGGEQFLDENRSSTAIVNTETVAWSEILVDDDNVNDDNDDEQEAASIMFTAQKTLEPGEEATMSYGDRSNDHFLIYYGFIPKNNPHDDVIIFENFDSAMIWHAMCFDEFWRREDIQARELNAVRAFKETSLALENTTDAMLTKSEPRMKVLSDGRVDARLLAAFAALYAGDEELSRKNAADDTESLNAARKDVALRCEQLLQTMQKASGKNEAEEIFESSLRTKKTYENETERVISLFRKNKMFILRDCAQKMKLPLDV
jgi:hypothetical protein